MSLRMSRKLIIFELFTIKVYARIYARFSVQNKEKMLFYLTKIVFYDFVIIVINPKRKHEMNFFFFGGILYRERMMGC